MKLKLLALAIGLLINTIAMGDKCVPLGKSASIFCAFMARGHTQWTATYRVGPNHDHIVSHDVNVVCFDAYCGRTVRIPLGTKMNGWVIQKDVLLKHDLSQAAFFHSMASFNLDPIQAK